MEESNSDPKKSSEGNENDEESDNDARSADDAKERNDYREMLAEIKEENRKVPETIAPWRVTITSRYEGRKIKKWLGRIRKQKITDIEGIKKFLSKIPNRDRKSNTNAANILLTILNCKQEGSRIYFNTTLFKRPLHYWIFGADVFTKCITNDFLNLVMNANIVIANENDNFDVLKYATLTNAYISSDNFRYKQNEKVKRGYVQDYDAKFSAMTAPDVPDEAVEKYLNDKPNSTNLSYEGIDYKCYGNTDMYFIAPSEMTEKEILKKYKSMKYLKSTDDQLTEGRETIPYNPDLHFIYKTLHPERFCPSYWSSTTGVNVNYLFEFSYDYNELYNYLVKSVKNDNINYPPNLCYWDSINQFFDLLGVIALTGPGISDNLRNKLSDLVDEYYDLKPVLRKVAQVFDLHKRVFKEFLDCFLYDADYLRMQRLQEKSAKCIARKNVLTDTGALKLAEDFFNKIPCAQMIQEQFGDACDDVINDVQESLTTYLKGKNPRGAEDQIKSTAKKILKLIPSNDIDFEKVCFPFLVPPGALCGKEIERDVVRLKSNKRAVEVIKFEKKEKDVESKMSEISEETDKIIEDYLKEWLRLHLEGKQMSLAWDEKAFIDGIFNALRGSNKKTEMLQDYALKFKKKREKDPFAKLISSHRNSILDGAILKDLINDYVINDGPKYSLRNRDEDEKALSDDEGKKSKSKSKSKSKKVEFIIPYPVPEKGKGRKTLRKGLSGKVETGRKRKRDNNI